MDVKNEIKFKRITALSRDSEALAPRLKPCSVCDCLFPPRSNHHTYCSGDCLVTARCERRRKKYNLNAKYRTRIIADNNYTGGRITNVDERYKFIRWYAKKGFQPLFEHYLNDAEQEVYIAHFEVERKRCVKTRTIARITSRVFYRAMVNYGFKKDGRWR